MMSTLHHYLIRLATVAFHAISAYCQWAENNSRSQLDLLALGLLPLVILATVLLLLPAFIGKPIAALLLALVALPTVYGVIVFIHALLTMEQPAAQKRD